MDVRKYAKAFVSLLMAAAMVMGMATAAYAENVSLSDGEDSNIPASESESIVVGYTVTDALGVPRSKIAKNDKVNITVQIKNLQLVTSDVTGGISVVRPIDSFGGAGNPVVSIKSAANSLLEYTVTFTGLVYSGDGQTLSFYLTYPKSDIAKEQLTVTVKQCVEYIEPTTAEPAPTVADTEAPMVVVGRGDIPANLKAGTAFTMAVTLKNISKKTSIQEGIVSFEPSDGLVIDESSASKQVGAILPGAVQTVNLKLKVTGSVESAVQSVSVSYKYSYKAGDGTTQQDTATEKLNVQVVPSKTTSSKGAASSAAPNIIVSSYSYGNPVAAGDSFTLKLAFKNTSTKTAIENIVMSVETGASLSISSSSNTYYVTSLGAGKAKSQSIKMKALSNGELTAGTVTITFSYEYLSGGERETKTTTESLNVPLFMPDRFSIATPEEQICTQGEECSVSLNYVNKGKGPVSNVEAQLVYGEDEVACEMPHQNLGNFEAGASGTIDFIFTPNNVGNLKLTAKITYEDEMQETKTLEIPIAVSVEEFVPMDDPENPEDMGNGEKTGMNKWAIIGISAGAAILIAAAVIVIVKLKKKKAKKSESIPEDFDWAADGAQPTEQANEAAEVHSDENA